MSKLINCEFINSGGEKRYIITEQNLGYRYTQYRGTIN